MCSWILATLPAMSPTVVSTWARAMRRVAAIAPRLWLGPAADPVLRERDQPVVGGRAHTQQVPPGRGDDALGARAAGEDQRLPGARHRRLERPGQAALQAAQRAPLARRVEEHEDVAALERLQHLVACQADTVAQHRVGDVRARGGGVGVELDLRLLTE